jgi:hypothetical protein
MFGGGGLRMAKRRPKKTASDRGEYPPRLLEIVDKSLKRIL